MAAASDGAAGSASMLVDTSMVTALVQAVCSLATLAQASWQWCPASPTAGSAVPCAPTEPCVCTCGAWVWPRPVAWAATDDAQSQRVPRQQQPQNQRLGAVPPLAVATSCGRGPSVTPEPRSTGPAGSTRAAPTGHPRAPSRGSEDAVPSPRVWCTVGGDRKAGLRGLRRGLATTPPRSLLLSPLWQPLGRRGRRGESRRDRRREPERRGGQCRRPAAVRWSAPAWRHAKAKQAVRNAAEEASALR